MLKICHLEFKEKDLDTIQIKIEKFLANVEDTWHVRSVSIVPYKRWFKQEFLCTIFYELDYEVKISLCHKVS